jgi:succinyl-diaminopimelate desuccinylase
MKTHELKKRAYQHIDAEKNALVKLCSEIVKIPSDNPPGNTRQLADFIKEYLEEKNVDVEVYEPKENNVSLLATIRGTSDRPHLILNGHLDQFPAEVGDAWSVDPYSGEVSDGKIFGRGVGDMKGGVSASIFSFLLMKKLGIMLPGTVTLMLVADEETGGQWGTGWLFKNVPNLNADACINGEPSGLTIRIGEKGRFGLRLTSYGKPAHGSFAGYAGENAIMKMMRILPLVNDLNKVKGRFTEETEKIIEDSTQGYEISYGESFSGMAQILKHVTTNIGVINGGSKVNIIPGTCEVEIDLRLPLGLTRAEIEQQLTQKILKADPTISIEHLEHPSTMFEANYTSPSEKIVEFLRTTIFEVTKNNPLYSFTSAATDCRYFRTRQIPSVVYGPKAYNMAAADEHITIEDLLTVTKVHAGTILDFQHGLLGH